MAPATPQPSFLATRRGKLTLALLCAVGRHIGPALFSLVLGCTLTTPKA